MYKKACRMQLIDITIIQLYDIGIEINICFLVGPVNANDFSGHVKSVIRTLVLLPFIY